ncbi:deoxycytidyl transferase [Bachmanniomyces sp. S44760]|nr:deoxycytidyl transferase [Bachmanniomyces sp. S44760]
MGSRLDVNSTAVRKKIEGHKFDDEEGEEYSDSKFGGFTDYFRRKKIKLQNLDAERRSLATNPPIFRGVVAHVNGYTQPSLNDLHALIVDYGGGFMQYLDGKTTVTHIIASNLTPKKKIEFRRYRIVKPAWVTDSVKAGRLLPWESYRVVDEGVGQQILGFDNGNVVSQTNVQYKGYKDQTDTSWYTEQVKGVVDELSRDDVQSTSEMLFLSTQTPPSAIGKDVNLDENFRSFHPTIIQKDVPGAGSGRLCTIGDPIGNSSTEVAQHMNDVVAGGDRTPIPFVSGNGSVELTQDMRVVKESTPQNTEQPVVDEDHSRLGIADQITEYPENEPNISESYGTNGVLDSVVRVIDQTHRTGLNETNHASLGKKTRATAEEHNAELLADPRVWKSTVVNPGFLKQYYEESRLHHLSIWKAELKSQLQALAAERSSSQKAFQKRPPGSRRYVLHVDFDSFFAAVSLLKHPEYVDKPTVVAHGGGSGSEIASCNYPARKYGVKNGMWMKTAQQLCSDLKVLPYDFKAYENASRNFYDAIMDTGGIVQSVSVDEALVDISVACVEAGGHGGKGIHEGSIWREQAKADEVAQCLRDEIMQKTGCAVSVGIGGNILLAKLALRKAKPAGQYQVKPEELLEFIGCLTVQDLPGVAYSIGGKLEELGVKFVRDVRELTKERLISTLGPKTGQKLWEYARGIDRTEVGEQVTRKSVSAEVNWGIRFVTLEQADEFVQSLCEELHKRLVHENVKGRQLTMKIMRRAADAPLDPPKHLGHGKCDTFSKSIVLGVATNSSDVLGREALSVMKGWGFSPGELRGIGVQMTKLEPLKGFSDGPLDGSQKRLQFKAGTSPTKPPLKPEDSVVDDVWSLQKPKPTLTTAAIKSELPGTITPDTDKVLDTFGSQFVLPSQVDPDVLAELPEDIRSKFQSNPQRSPGIPQETEPLSKSRSISPARYTDAVPSHSQLDQETLNALPEDVRAEILAFYDTQAPAKPRGQSLLPQSPRKVRAITNKKATTPTKKRTGGLFSRSKASAMDANSTLTQSNFVAATRSTTSGMKAKANVFDNEMDSTEEVSPEFLEALPEDIRREVLAQQRRDRLKKRGGIDLLTKNQNKRKPPTRNATNIDAANYVDSHQPGVQRRIRIPPKDPKPTFTARKLSALEDLRDAISSWFGEFRDEGPYDEDVLALEEYLKKVVGEERDMAKAVGVVQWLRWIVDEGNGEDGWKGALRRLEEGIGAAVEARGLGVVVF